MEEKKLNFEEINNVILKAFYSFPKSDRDTILLKTFIFFLNEIVVDVIDEDF